jgi:putative peptidoglycan binding protein
MTSPGLSLLAVPVLLGAALLGAGCAVPIALSVVSYGADGVALAGTGKTATDHMISMISTKDCALWRIVRGQKICTDRVGEQNPYQVNYSEPQRSVSEGGVQYGPPLRAAADAPASSWDAAAYQAAPTPPAAANARMLTPDEVREVQSRLKSFGFAPGSVDGLPGPQTAAAIRRYEAARAVAQAGNTDRATLDRLRSDKTRPAR